MQLDLSLQGELSIEDAILIDEIAPKVQEQYNRFIEQVVRENELNGLHLLMSVCSRNPFHSAILPLMCKVLLLEEKLKRGDKITLITTESALMLTIIHSVLDKFDQNIPVRVNRKQIYVQLILLICMKLLKSVYYIILSWIWPRLTMVYKKQPSASIVLVDNFMLPNSFTKKGEFIDRYYTGYDHHLSSAQRQKIWYSPTLFGFKTLGKSLKMSILAKKSQHNFLFQESWLSLYDYIHALFLTLTLPFKVKKSPLFMGYNIYQLLIFETRGDIFSPSLTMAICKFKFIKNLQSAKVKICQVLDWHENQDIDKALNLGFHQYYPSVIVKGYQGYIAPPYWTHTIPRSFELENSTLPSQLYVISENYKKIVLDSCPSLDVRVASAFRFSYLNDLNRDVSVSDIPTILIALPIGIDESKNILNTCVQLHSLINIKINIFVKHHPVHESQVFARKVPEFLNEAFMPTNDNMSDLLKHVSMLISSASSVCAEAASLGIPVAIYGNRYGVTMNPIANIHNVESSVFYCQEHLVEFVDLYIGEGDLKSPVNNFYIYNNESSQDLFVCDNYEE